MLHHGHCCEGSIHLIVLYLDKCYDPQVLLRDRSNRLLPDRNISSRCDSTESESAIYTYWDMSWLKDNTNMTVKWLWSDCSQYLVGPDLSTMLWLGSVAEIFYGDKLMSPFLNKFITFSQLWFWFTDQYCDNRWWSHHVLDSILGKPTEPASVFLKIHNQNLTVNSCSPLWFFIPSAVWPYRILHLVKHSLFLLVHHSIWFFTAFLRYYTT